MNNLSPEIIAAAQTSHKKFWPRGPFVSVSLAQYAEESGWGTHLSGRFNYFGMKATQTEIARGDVSWVHTKEQTSFGQWYTIRAAFRNFASMEEAFDAHAELLTTPHYADCMAAADPFAYCDALRKDGYATALAYSEALKNIIRGSNLTQYDQRF